jgi:hypothetical protein
MAGAQPRTSCRSLFKKLDIIPFHCQYIPSLMTYMIQNQENFKTNSSVQNLNIRNKHHFIDKMPTYLVSKKVQFMLASKFSTAYYAV